MGLRACPPCSALPPQEDGPLTLTGGANMSLAHAAVQIFAAIVCAIVIFAGSIVGYERLTSYIQEHPMVDKLRHIGSPYTEARACRRTCART